MVLGLGSSDGALKNRVSAYLLEPVEQFSDNAVLTDINLISVGRLWAVLHEKIGIHWNATQAHYEVSCGCGGQLAGGTLCF